MSHKYSYPIYSTLIGRENTITSSQKGKMVDLENCREKVEIVKITIFRKYREFSDKMKTKLESSVKCSIEKYFHGKNVRYCDF